MNPRAESKVAKCQGTYNRMNLPTTVCPRRRWTYRQSWSGWLVSSITTPVLAKLKNGGFEVFAVYACFWWTDSDRVSCQMCFCFGYSTTVVRYPDRAFTCWGDRHLPARRLLGIPGVSRQKINWSSSYCVGCISPAKLGQRRKTSATTVLGCGLIHLLLSQLFGGFSHLINIFSYFFNGVETPTNTPHVRFQVFDSLRAPRKSMETENLLSQSDPWDSQPYTGVLERGGTRE